MKEKITLLLIILLTVILRFVDLGKVPVSPDWDEVSLGYNAYSLLTTGKDEFKQSYPIIFRSFDDYKPGLYVYLAMPFVKFIGLSTVAVRLPSAIFGVLTVAVVYFLVKKLFSFKQDGTLKYLPLLSAFVLAISPWHIQFSRIAFEANISLSLLIFGLYLFLLAQNNFWLYIPSTLFFALTFYTYQSAKIFTPLFLAVLFFVYLKKLIKLREKILIPLISFIIFVSPFLIATVSTPQALMRASGVSIFSDKTQFLKKNVQRIEYDQKNNDYLGLLFDNRRVTYFTTLISGYMSHFDLKWLFLTGDYIARHQPPDFGHLYLIELPFLLIGFYCLFKNELKKDARLLLILWIAIVPISASFTTDIPHAIRTINFLPVFQILTALGILTFFSLLTKSSKIIYSVSLGLFIALFSLNFFYYLDQYFVQYNYFCSSAWQYGYEKTVGDASSLENKYNQIVVSNKQPMDQSYMFFLFYKKYDPVKYLNEGGTKSGGFAEENKFGKYVFRRFNFTEEKKTKILFIGSPQDFPSNVAPLKTINFLDGKPAILFVAT